MFIVQYNLMRSTNEAKIQVGISAEFINFNVNNILNSDFVSIHEANQWIIITKKVHRQRTVL